MRQPALCGLLLAITIADQTIIGSGEAAPALPAPAGGESTGVQQLSLGQKVALDHKGPTIVSPEGTLLSISNWEELSDREREVAWRRIKARNQERLKTLEQETAASRAAAQGTAGAAEAAAEQPKREEL